ncbi:MAG: hypothetical protein QM710_10250 [Flavobacterium sp.]
MEETKTTAAAGSNNGNAKQGKNSPLRAVMIFIIFFGGAFFGTKLFMKPSVDKELAKVAESVNKTCPMQIDQFTTLKNVVTLPNKTIQYNCQLNQLTKAEIQMDIVKKDVFPKLLKNVKENPQMESFRDNDVTIRYSYTDKNNEFVTEYVITPKMYK